MHDAPSVASTREIGGQKSLHPTLQETFRSAHLRESPGADSELCSAWRRATWRSMH
jgi:hypothetical protein